MPRASFVLAALSSIALVAACDQSEKPETVPAKASSEVASATPPKPSATAKAPSPPTSASASAKVALKKPDKDNIEVIDSKIDKSLPDVPEGKSKPPTVAEWKDAPEVNSQEKNSRPADCFMKMKREWLKVNCTGEGAEIIDRDGFGKEGTDYFVFQTKPKGSPIPSAVDVVVRLKEGQSLTMQVHRIRAQSAALFTHWPKGAKKPNIVALGGGQYPTYSSCGG